MRDRVITVLGAGNLRCGPPVLAALASWLPDDLVTIKLFDANEERLDLLDRFIRECLSKEETAHSVQATTDWKESLADATEVVLCLHEDCARRMTGSLQTNLFNPAEVDEGGEVFRGDPNRPTLPDNLSEQTTVLLSSPINTGLTREEAISQALNQLTESVPERARVISLIRDVNLPNQFPGLQIDWPAPIPEERLSIVPHQLLRWIHGEDSLGAYIRESRESPFSHWLNDSA